jgi:NADP-dependent 3-hydroxy acid dehydrogenase YdfG
MSGIRNKLIVITGASSGIGEAIAIHLAQQGAKLVIGARRLPSLKSVAQRIEHLNGNVAFKETDVRCRQLSVGVERTGCRFSPGGEAQNRPGL